MVFRCYIPVVYAEIMNTFFNNGIHMQKKMLKQQKKVEAGQGREKTAQLVEEKEDDENIELYKICHQLFVRNQEAISLVEKLYMDDYFVPDRKIEWLERYKGGGNKSIFCKRVLG